MPQLPVDKTFFAFAGGLNTEASPLAFPEGTSLDEQNFEMLINGTRRRRKGLRRESGHVTGDVSVAGTYHQDMCVSSYRWTNVAGNPDIVFIVMQVGGSLVFAVENEDLTTNIKADFISLTDMGTTLTEADVYTRPVSMTSGRGFLFVTGRYVDPFYVSYDVATDTFTSSRIPIYVRDFRGVEDGTDLREQPTTLSDDHNYNLINRGWNSVIRQAYFTATGGYPAKNQQYWRGYRRATTAGYSELDGTKEFNAAKLEAEAFGDTTAPQGALVLNPFNTGLAKLASAGTLVDISSFTYAVTYGTLWLVTVTTGAAHGLSPGDTITVTNNEFTYNQTTGAVATGSLDGTYNVNTTPSATEFSIYYYAPSGYSSWLTQYVSKGQVGSDIVIRTDAYSTDERPQAVAYHAGRVFWAGASHPEINDTIYFSQIAFNEKQFGLCYQAADPTSEFITALAPSDGGTIIVPNMGSVRKMISMEDALVVFAENGVWAILPASQGGFRADGYNVRKISEVECISQLGILKGDIATTFISQRGIYVLQPDPNSGQINAASISEQSVQSLFNAIPDARKREIQIVYDDAKKRVYYLYGDETVISKWTYNAALVWDARLGTFYKLTFPHTNVNASFKIRHILVTGLGDSTDSAKKVKFLVTKSSSGVKVNICDFDQTVFTDWDDTEQDAYILTGYDNLGDFARHRQAPIIHVYMQKTETGFTEGVDEGLDAVGESSCFMQARWDWADATTSGKFGTEQQVYRHVRYYQPTGSGDTYNSGYPVIVTRNKIRGRGRCLHLKFRAGPGKDCHILGWSIEYKGEKKQ